VHECDARCENLPSDAESFPSSSAVISSVPEEKCFPSASNGFSATAIFAPFSTYTSGNNELCPVLSIATTSPKPEIFPLNESGSSTFAIFALRIPGSVTRSTFTLNSSGNDQPVSSYGCFCASSGAQYWRSSSASAARE